MKKSAKPSAHLQLKPGRISTKPQRKVNTMTTEISSTQQTFLDGLTPLRRARMYKVFGCLLGRNEPADPCRKDTDIDPHVIDDRNLKNLCQLNGWTRDQAWAAYDDLLQTGLASYLWDEGHPRIVLTEAGEQLLPQMVEEVFEVNLR